MRLPVFNFEHEVTSSNAKQDKVEIEVEGRFFGTTDEASSFVNYLGCPPEHLRSDPEILPYGPFFSRPNRLDPPFHDQTIRPFTLVLGGQRRSPPLIDGHLEIKQLHQEQWRLRLIASLNPTRFVRHQQLPSRLDLSRGVTPPNDRLFKRDVELLYHGEFSYCDNDNWIPSSRMWQIFASPTFWPHHLSTCIGKISTLKNDLQRAANTSQGSLGTDWNYNVRHVETYWEFVINDPNGVVGELHENLRLFSRRRVNREFYEIATDLYGNENTSCLTLKTRVGEWLKIYAKTNQRIRIEMTHILTGSEGFDPPEGRHTFATVGEVKQFVVSLSEIAAVRVNRLFRHLQNHAQIPANSATVLMFIGRFQESCQSADIAHELLQLLWHHGSFVVGNGNPLGRIFRDELRRLVRNGILESSNQRYSVAPEYRKALASLKERGTGFLVRNP